MDIRGSALTKLKHAKVHNVAFIYMYLLFEVQCTTFYFKNTLFFKLKHDINCQMIHL